MHRVSWSTAETAARRAAPATGRGSAVVPWHPRPLLAKKARPPGVAPGGLAGGRLAARYFPALWSEVSSPREPLTAVFGMGTGVSAPPVPPTKGSATDDEGEPQQEATRTLACRFNRPSGVLSPGRRAGSGQVSRPIRTGRLRRSRALHRRPVHPVVSRGASVACARGSFIFGEAWRLDAFSAYPVATWLPGRALRQDNRRTRGRPSPVLSY